MPCATESPTNRLTNKLKHSKSSSPGVKGVGGGGREEKRGQERLFQPKIKYKKSYEHSLNALCHSEVEVLKLVSSSLYFFTSFSSATSHAFYIVKKKEKKKRITWTFSCLFCGTNSSAKHVELWIETESENWDQKNNDKTQNQTRMLEDKNNKNTTEIETKFNNEPRKKPLWSRKNKTQSNKDNMTTILNI